MKEIKFRAWDTQEKNKMVKVKSFLLVGRVGAKHGNKI